MDGAGRKARARIEALRDPREGEEWFQDLPDSVREAKTRHWRHGQQRMLHLVRDSRRVALREALAAGVLFAAVDGLLAAHSSLGAIMVQFVVGSLVGLFWTVLDANRLLAIPLAVFAFAPTLVLTRGGLLPQHLFVLIFVAGGAAYLGIRREERFYE